MQQNMVEQKCAELAATAVEAGRAKEPRLLIAAINRLVQEDGPVLTIYVLEGRGLRLWP